MQLVQFFIFSFFMSFIMSSSHLFFGLSSGRVSIGFHSCTFFLPFSLLAFDVNGQTNLIFVLLCGLLCSYVLLIHLIHRLFRFSMYRLFLLQKTANFPAAIGRWGSPAVLITIRRSSVIATADSLQVGRGFKQRYVFTVWMTTMMWGDSGGRAPRSRYWRKGTPRGKNRR